MHIKLTLHYCTTPHSSDGIPELIYEAGYLETECIAPQRKETMRHLPLNLMKFKLFLGNNSATNRKKDNMKNNSPISWQLTQNFLIENSPS